MRVVVDAAVFDDPGDEALALLDVMATGVEGRHVVVVDPPLRTSAEARAAFARWVERLLAPAGSIARSLTEHYMRASTRDDRVAIRTEVRVVVAKRSAWNVTPPCVTLEDARRLVREPLAIILEDAVNDGAFLLTLSEVAGDAGRRLRERLSRAWLRVAHGGGIDSIPRLLRGLDEAPMQRLRCQVVVDHDGDTTDNPSRKSRFAQEACDEYGVPFLRLRRRAIENYAPREALERWGRGELFVRKEVTPERWRKILQNPGSEAMLAERQEALQKWDAMDEADRRHAPLKSLLSEDIAERVFAGYVAGKARPGGGAQPERFVIQPAWLRRGDCAAEAEHIVESLLRSA